MGSWRHQPEWIVTTPLGDDTDERVDDCDAKARPTLQQESCRSLEQGP